MQYLEIGAAPPEEEPVQMGIPGYTKKALQECNRYIKLLRKTLGPEPPHTELRPKGFQHDFGTYYEVVCYYDEHYEESIEYAFNCESKGPLTWND
jgi:hypothetical protein